LSLLIGAVLYCALSLASLVFLDPSNIDFLFSNLDTLIESKPAQSFVGRFGESAKAFFDELMMLWVGAILAMPTT